MFSLFLRVACAALFYACAAASAIVGFGAATIAAVFMLCFLVLPAAAASIDMSPVVEVALQFANELIVGLVLVLAGYLVALIRKKTGIDLAVMQQGDNGMFHDMLRRGVDSAEAKIREKYVRDRELVLTVNSPIVAALTNRALAASPGLLKRMGVTETALRERVLEHVRMKINQIA